MTALTSNDALVARVPGAYRQQRARAAEALTAPTDVTGFIGFEPARSDRPRPDARRPVCCDDWRDYVRVFGEPPKDGTLLGPAVRAYFTNGGRRCYVFTVEAPDQSSPAALDKARGEIVGIEGASEREATGLERLLLVEEISLIDVPDLYARRAVGNKQEAEIPGLDREACFEACTGILGPAGKVIAKGPTETADPLYSEDEVFDTQKRMLARCIPERWRVLLLLSPPCMRGVFEPPSPEDAEAWRDVFDRGVKSEGFAEQDEVSCAALYYPWVLTQEKVGAEIQALPPSSVVAGVIARRDLARGPFISPANESLVGAVGLSWPMDEDTHGRLYEPDRDTGGLEVPSINILRPFPGYGIQVWGARTLSTDTWMRYLSVRRGLSAIERQCKVALDAIVFEPHTPALWLLAAQLVSSVLMPVYEAGGMRGTTPEEAFYIRCDGSVNPPESIAEGRLLCEVGVALAAPAEYIVFRIGRREGVIEVLE